MSDIARWAAFDGGIAPHPCGKWILYDDHQAEVERLAQERDDYRAEFERLVVERNDYRFEVERVTAERDAAQAEVKRLTAERDEARAERDAAQRERERVQDLLWLRGRELPTLQRDQPAQNLDMGTGQATLDTSRPTDETIWREVFVRSVNTPSEFKVAFADWALAEYRKRWPR